ncbi:MAG: hypothetical protein ACXADL_06540 [Candidatus Thorarchaeota archaeon]|jgi:hypothetical protein
MTRILETKAEKALILFLILFIVLGILGTQGALWLVSGPLGIFVAIVALIGIGISYCLVISHNRTPKYLRAAR